MASDAPLAWQHRLTCCTLQRTREGFPAVERWVSVIEHISLESPSPLFDEQWYLTTYPDVAEAGLPPWRHYCLHGASEGRRPNRYFDGAWYLAAYPDLRESGVDPLSHYLEIGCWEGRDPGPEFDTDAYLEAHPQLRDERRNPLLHALSASTDTLHGAGRGANGTTQERSEEQGREYPTAVTDEEGRFAAAVDRAYTIPGRGLFVIGWLLDPAHRIVDLRLLTSGGTSDNLVPQLIRYPRPDVTEIHASWSIDHVDGMLGFAALAEGNLDATDALRSTTLELSEPGGHVTRLGIPRDGRLSLGEVGAIRDILRRVPIEDHEALDRHVAPAVSALWASRRLGDTPDREIEVGHVPDRPDVSIIVPVYGRYDLIEYQLSLFADDLDLKRAEIIYVVDDPSVGTAVTGLCRERYPLLRVPVRLVIASQNRGFAGAVNAGASRASAPRLLLMNSDVLPGQSGWLANLEAVFDSLPAPALLAPRLLFPDGSVQHQGVDFYRSSIFPRLWLNRHPGKGLPPVPAEPGDAVEVPAVSGACVLLEQELYRQLGGLSEEYVIGDFEDTDLCLKAREAGGASWVAPGVTLYHLERQSLVRLGDRSWRTSLTLCNAWRHTRAWGPIIEEIMEGGRS